MSRSCTGCKHENTSRLVLPCSICGRNTFRRIVKSTAQVKSGLEDMIDRYLHLREILKTGSASTLHECEQRIKYMNEFVLLDNILKNMGIQGFELESEEYELIIK